MTKLGLAATWNSNRRSSGAISISVSVHTMCSLFVLCTHLLPFANAQ